MVNSNAPTLDRIFHALADPTRRAILRDLSGRPKTVGQLAVPHRMSLAAVSKHLKVLERARLVGRRKQGSFHIVNLQPVALRPASAWIAFYEHFWDRRLDALQDLLEAEPRGPGAGSRRVRAKRN